MKNKKGSILLSLAAIVGIGMTAYFAAKSTPVALKNCAMDCDCSPSDFFEANVDDKIKIAKSLAKSYTPAIACGLATASCVIGVNVLNHRQQASIIGAYTMLEQSYKQYQKRVTDIFGDEGSRKIRAETAKDDYTPNTYCPSPGEQLFYDYCTGTYFESSFLSVVDAEYQLNRKLALNGEVSLRDYCDLMGIDCGEFADKRGWSVEASEEFYNHAWIDFEHELTILDDGMECYVIYMPIPPIVMT